MAILDQVVSRLGAGFMRISRGEYYELKDTSIVFHKFLFGERVIAQRDIKFWSIIPEMGVDFVKIELIDGEGLLLADKRNDLIGALNKIAPDRKLGDELDRLK